MKKKILFLMVMFILSFTFLFKNMNSKDILQENIKKYTDDYIENNKNDNMAIIVFDKNINEVIYEKIKNP